MGSSARSFDFYALHSLNLSGCLGWQVSGLAFLSCRPASYSPHIGGEDMVHFTKLDSTQPSYKKASFFREIKIE